MRDLGRWTGSPSCALALLLAGCASIQSFSAAPRTACSGDSVTVAWKAEGDVTLDSEPPLPETGPKASAGTERFTPQQDTRFVLRASRLFSSASAEADVALAPPAREFGGVATCSEAAGAVSLAVPLTGRQVSPGLRVGSLINMNRRTVTLEKDDLAASVAPGTASSAFNGRPVAGTWTLRAPLAPNETCDQALAALASRLTFRVAFACGE